MPAPSNLLIAPSAPASSADEASAEITRHVDALFSRTGDGRVAGREEHEPELDEIIEGKAPNLVGVFSALDETAYVWDLLSDRIDWERNVGDVLTISNLDEVSTGAQFHQLINPEHRARRTTAILEANSSERLRGVPYRLHYKFRPSGLRGPRCIWLEDSGRWWPGRDGRPQRARGVVRVINESYIAEQSRLHRNDFDELTGQLNRIRMSGALEAIIERARETDQSCGFLIAAVNNLSVFNETFGFDVGDEVLRATSQVIKSKLRGGDTLGRYSSNKFGIILNDCGPGAMRIAAERFMNAVRSSTIRTSSCQLAATISVGGVIVPAQAASVPRAISCALQALDQARNKRFDAFVAYQDSPSRETVRQRNIAIADEVISALDQDRMRLVLQPLVSAKTGKPELYEGLLRMIRPDGSVVSAGNFITVAEQLGLARLIDRRTLELAIDLLNRHEDLSLSVNVSSLTTTDRDWMNTLRRLTTGRPALPKRLIVEITETAAIDSLDHTSAFVDTVKEMGCRLAIDDFGAGYTSFKNLKHLDVDILKIDGAFVRNLKTDKSDRVFIKTMVDLAETFGLQTVAEWVCDEESAKILIDTGIDYLQGYHYGEPVTQEEFSKRQADV